MSEPKRYHHFIKFYSKSFTDVTGARYCYPDAGMIEDKDGKYVEYEDYARLKAEVEHLTSDLQMEKENEDRLVRLHQDARNEVERLNEAGDVMAIMLQHDEVSKDWHAAKEGKQS
jgi:hypothetical protein